MTHIGEDWSILLVSGGWYSLVARDLCVYLPRPFWNFFLFPFLYYLALLAVLKMCNIPLSPFAFYYPIFLCTKFVISRTLSLPRMPNVGQLMWLWKHYKRGKRYSFFMLITEEIQGPQCYSEKKGDSMF